MKLRAQSLIFFDRGQQFVIEKLNGAVDLVGEGFADNMVHNQV